MSLSVIIPALDEAENLRLLLPELRAALNHLDAPFEILVVTAPGDPVTRQVVEANGGRVVEQADRGYGGALKAGFRAANGEFFLTMDADLSHMPAVIAALWQHRDRADIIIASRYVEGGSAQMPFGRYVLSRVLNGVFSRGLGLGVRDMSSGFRLYRAGAIDEVDDLPADYDVVQTLLVRAFAEGWRVAEVPFAYRPRRHGPSHARVLRFGAAYLQDLLVAVEAAQLDPRADYDARAHDSVIWLQRYWQRMRHRHVTELIAGEGAVARHRLRVEPHHRRSAARQRRRRRAASGSCAMRGVSAFRWSTAPVSAAVPRRVVSVRALLAGDRARPERLADSR